MQVLAFIYENVIAHEGVQPGNVLSGLNDVNLEPEDVLWWRENVQSKSNSPPVQRLENKQDKLAPVCICVTQELTPFTDYTQGYRTKSSDMNYG